MAPKGDAESRSPGTREKILEAAERLIAAHGTEGFQLKDVAAAVGVRPPSIYAHFGSRDDIAREVASRLYDRIAAEVQIDESGDPMKTILGMVRDYVHYLADNPAQLRLILRDLAHTAFPTPAVATPSVQTWEAISDAVTALVHRGVEAGQFRPVRPEGVHAQLVGAVMASMCWAGWDEDGNPMAGVPVAEIVRESQELVRRLLRVSDE